MLDFKKNVPHKKQIQIKQLQTRLALKTPMNFYYRITDMYYLCFSLFVFDIFSVHLTLLFEKDRQEGWKIKNLVSNIFSVILIFNIGQNFFFLNLFSPIWNQYCMFIEIFCVRITRFNIKLQYIKSLSSERAERKLRWPSFCYYFPLPKRWTLLISNLNWWELLSAEWQCGTDGLNVVIIFHLCLSTPKSNYASHNC